MSVERAASGSEPTSASILSAARARRNQSEEVA
jgi:hypothetical protein